MSSSLTVADAQAVLESYAPPSAFLSWLNQVCERYVLSGIWVGNRMTVDFDSSSGYIVLPPQYLSVLGVTKCGWPLPTFSQYHEYVENGPGYLDPSAGLGMLIDMGDVCTRSEIETAGTLRLKINDVLDVAKEVRIYGLDADGVAVTDPSDGYDGLVVTLASPSVTTTQVFSKVTGVLKDETVARVSLWVVNGADETQLANYLPGETKPRYKRYKTGIETQVIRTICRRRHTRLVANTDWVHPDNLGALKFGFRALNYEDAGDLDRSTATWKLGEELLNQELGANRGVAKAPAPVRTSGILRGGKIRVSL